MNSAATGMTSNMEINAVCDIHCRYLRLHVCYYNSSGLLVWHPRYTAVYYLKHSFAVDFFTALPVKLVLDCVMSKKEAAFIVLLKVIRAYRITNGFAYFRRDILKKPPTYL